MELPSPSRGEWQRLYEAAMAFKQEVPADSLGFEMVVSRRLLALDEARAELEQWIR